MHVPPDADNAIYHLYAKLIAFVTSCIKFATAGMQLSSLWGTSDDWKQYEFSSKPLEYEKVGPSFSPVRNDHKKKNSSS